MLATTHGKKLYGENYTVLAKRKCSYNVLVVVKSQGQLVCSLYPSTPKPIILFHAQEAHWLSGTVVSQVQLPMGSWHSALHPPYVGGLHKGLLTLVTVAGLSKQNKNIFFLFFLQRC